MRIGIGSDRIETECIGTFDKTDSPGQGHSAEDVCSANVFAEAKTTEH